MTISFATLAQTTESAQAEVAKDADQALSVEEILRREPQAGDYGAAPRCIQTRQIRQVEVLDDRHVSFKLSREQFILVQFEHRCPGLRRGGTVIYEPSSGNRLCVLDSIRGTYSGGLGGFTPGSRCSIDSFQSVTKEQLVLLKNTLQAQRRKKKDAQ